MDKSALDILEFGKLLEIVSGYSYSEASKGSVLDIAPLDGREEIEVRQSRIQEIMRMAREGGPLRLSGFPDISRLVAKTKPEGAVLEAFELAGFIPVLEIAADVSHQITDRDDLPHLSELVVGLTGFPDILKILKKSVDRDGNILDGASFLLADLRERTRRLETRITRKLEEIVRDEKVSLFLQDDFITKRSGRWVIPVRMDSKGQVAGVVHDVSKSGETAFVEPLAILNLANELENLVAEAKAEEIRILRTISAKIRESADGIGDEYATIVHLDVLNSIARFADSLEMQIPAINESGEVKLVRGRHPLLCIALRKTGDARPVVPLDVALGGRDRVMVITGSNAGGKTIAIKTIGLLLIMALSGMPVPADSSSTFPLSRDLLVDIGDEQSIENSLSTFSAHITNISEILEKSGAGAVSLIDELGTGTDPDEGAALACAVLNELKERGALAFATTHLSEIKGFVHRTEGMLNASMEFDAKTQTPLYRLRVGEPGQSHALDTAKRFGLPQRIIDSAKKMMGSMKVEFDNMIADLNRKRAEYEHLLSVAAREKAEIEEKGRLLSERLSETERLTKETLAKAHRESAEIILAAKRQMNSLLEELKKTDRAKSREAIREAIKHAEEGRREAAKRIAEYEVAEAGVPTIGEVAEGDTVFVRSLGYDATVVKVMKKLERLKVSAGSVEVEVPLSDVRFGKGKFFEAGSVETKTATVDEMPPSRINLIGLRVDEALEKLEPFLNHASLAGLPEVTIIHGYGTGALARAVRGHLKGHPLIKVFRGGQKSEGGYGVTVATLA